MKYHLRWLCLLIAIILLLGFSLIHFPKQISEPQNQLVDKTNLGQPTRLIIPTLHIEAKIQNVGISPNGIMENPSNIVDVGWFDLGTRPGQKGSAVVAGHLNGEHGEIGVFANLHKLKKGDKIYINDSKGASITFIVRESRLYDPGYAEEVFSQNDNAHLNLITCEGIWDKSKRSYSKRLVVFSDVMSTR